MNFKDTFNDWMKKGTDHQLEVIDEICQLLDITYDDWFAEFLNRRMRDYGVDFLKELRSDFIFYVSGEFQKCLLKYIKPDGYNIHKKPYLSIDLEFDYIPNKGFIIMNKKSVNKTFKKLTINQKEELMKNKLFSTIVIQTNLKIYSKTDIRFLKIKSLNEYSKSIEE